MPPLLPILALLTACPGPGDSALPTTETHLDPTIGSIVWVAWDHPHEGTINLHYRVADEDWRPTLAAPLDPGPQELPLLGLPYDATVEYHATLDGETVVEGSIDTEHPPASLPPPPRPPPHPAPGGPHPPHPLTRKHPHPPAARPGPRSGGPRQPLHPHQHRPAQ